MLTQGRFVGLVKTNASGISPISGQQSSAPIFIPPQGFQGIPGTEYQEGNTGARVFGQYRDSQGNTFRLVQDSRGGLLSPLSYLEQTSGNPVGYAERPADVISAFRNFQGSVPNGMSIYDQYQKDQGYDVKPGETFQSYNQRLAQEGKNQVGYVPGLGGQAPTSLTTGVAPSQLSVGGFQPVPGDRNTLMASAGMSDVSFGAGNPLANIPNLGPGSTGPAVKQLQEWLVSQGYLTQDQMNTGPGVYGPRTKAAVQAWQRAAGIDTAGNPGYFGPRSREFLKQTPTPNVFQAQAGGNDTFDRMPFQKSPVESIAEEIAREKRGLTTEAVYISPSPEDYLEAERRISRGEFVKKEDWRAEVANKIAREKRGLTFEAVMIHPTPEDYKQADLEIAQGKRPQPVPKGTGFFNAQAGGGSAAQQGASPLSQMTPGQAFALGQTLRQNMGAPTGQQFGGGQPSTQQGFQSTGNPQADAIIKSISDILDKQVEQGKFINPDMEIDHATVQKLVDKATQLIHPFYAQKISAIKDDLTRSSNLLQQNYNLQKQQEAQTFKQSLDTSREAASGAGTVFSGQRMLNEQNAAEAQNRSLSSLGLDYGNRLGGLQRSAEQQLGTQGFSSLGYQAPNLTRSLASLTGRGGLTDSGSLDTGYTSGLYPIGELQRQEQGDVESRTQLLKDLLQKKKILNPSQSYQNLL